MRASLLGRHLAQRAIERFRPEEERAVQRHAVDLALENAGVDQAEKRLDQHFADAIKPLRRTARLSAGAAPGASRFMMAWNCALSRWRTISPCASASPTCPMPICKRAAVGHEARGMKPDRVFGVADRLGRRREQRKIRRGAVEHRGKFIRRQIAGARHERQFGIDLADQLERRAAFARGRAGCRAWCRCCSSGCSASRHRPHVSRPVG